MARPASPVRDRLVAAQAERAERLNQVEAGEMVPAAAVKAEWVGICVEIRQRLLAIPARVDSTHPGNQKIIAALERELHSVLNFLADGKL